jgi:hypothetical protein
MVPEPAMAREKPIYRSNVARAEHPAAIKKNDSRRSLMNRERKTTNSMARRTNTGSDQAMIEIRTNVSETSSVAAADTASQGDFRWVRSRCPAEYIVSP